MSNDQPHESAPGVDVGGVTFPDLEPHHCRYAYGEALPYRFCGQRKRVASSYCAVHHLLCTEVFVPRVAQTSEQRERKKVSRFSFGGAR